MVEKTAWLSTVRSRWSLYSIDQFHLGWLGRRPQFENNIWASSPEFSFNSYSKEYSLDPRTCSTIIMERGIYIPTYAPLVKFSHHASNLFSNIHWWPFFWCINICTGHIIYTVGYEAYRNLNTYDIYFQRPKWWWRKLFHTDMNLRLYGIIIIYLPQLIYYILYPWNLTWAKQVLILSSITYKPTNTCQYSQLLSTSIAAETGKDTTCQVSLSYQRWPVISAQITKYW
jgi:hypothetical protein